MPRGAATRIMSSKKTRRKRFDFEQTKLAATSDDPVVRKKMFKEYFEDFSEFPSYLFDNAAAIDPKLLATMLDLRNDPETSKEMQNGIDMLLERLPSA